MFSIEDVESVVSKEDNDFTASDFIERLTNNRPYKCITILPYKSCVALENNSIDLNKRSIIWFDYDYALDDNVLSDIEKLVTTCSSGTVLIFSVYAGKYPTPYDDALGKKPHPLVAFNQKVTRHVDPGLETADITNPNLTPYTYRNIIHNTIIETLAQRNIGTEPNEVMNYSQLYNFIYSDGALMLTVGGILFSQNEKNSFDLCKFSSLQFISNKNAPFHISVPKMTYKEMFDLGKQLPRSISGDTTESPHSACPGIPRQDIDNFHRIYRYIPRYGEIIY